jgi:hypothetical protein
MKTRVKFDNIINSYFPSWKEEHIEQKLLGYLSALYLTEKFRLTDHHSIDSRFIFFVYHDYSLFLCARGRMSSYRIYRFVLLSPIRSSSI